MAEEKQKTDAAADVIADAILDGIAESLTHEVKQVSPDEKVIVAAGLDGAKSFVLEKDEKAMTVQEKLDALKNVQDYEAEISSKLKEIIKNTYDSHCYLIDNFIVGGKFIDVTYSYTCRGYGDTDYATIPREWLDEGFDYKAAFKEECRKAEENRKKAEQEDAEHAEKKRKEEEYKHYLKLKEKYEEDVK